MFCEYCGKEVENNAEFCPHCGMALANDSIASTIKGVTERFKKPDFSEPKLDPPKTVINTPQQTAGTTGVIDTALAEGEVIVKRYNCADVRGVKGYLTVTNKRLLFNASGGNSRYNQEVTLSSVSGLTCYKGTNFDLKLIIIGAICALLGIAFLSMAGNSFGSGAMQMMGFIFLAIGGLLIFLGIRSAFQIAVYAKDVSISPIVVGEGPKSLIGNSALFAIASTPTADTDIMLSELGALVQDLQSMGDLAIEKWQNRFNPQDLPSL